MVSAVPSVAPWPAAFQADPPPAAAGLSPSAVGRPWLALGQAWRSDGPEAGFRPGWAQVGWSPGVLHFSAVFVGSAQANRARHLNERTWELGSVCEVFLQVAGASRYLELHVTPENQRLQLLWPVGGLERFRRNEAPLENFLVNQPDWVRSRTHVAPDFWSAQITVPWSCVGLDAGAPPPAFRAAVCRYDSAGGAAPVCSSTAPLREFSFHRFTEWQDLTLSPP